MVQQLGSKHYYISLSAAIGGIYPVRYPVGPYILLWAESWENPRENKDKMKEMSNNASYNNRMGKMGRMTNLRKCVLMDDNDVDTAVNPLLGSNTLAYNEKITLLDSWCGISEAAVYMIVTPLVDNPDFVQPNTDKDVNVALSRKGRVTPLDYMKGTIKRLNPRPLGNIFILDLDFKETSLF